MDSRKIWRAFALSAMHAWNEGFVPNNSFNAALASVTCSIASCTCAIATCFAEVAPTNSHCSAVGLSGAVWLLQARRHCSSQWLRKAAIKDPRVRRLSSQSMPCSFSRTSRLALVKLAMPFPGRADKTHKSNQTPEALTRLIKRVSPCPENPTINPAKAIAFFLPFCEVALARRP